MKRILITGGLGFIGSHTCVALVEAGYHPVVIDNLRNSDLSVKSAIEEIINNPLEFYQLDAKNSIEVSRLIGSIDGIIHFAALKSVSESIENPMEYYTENLESLISIINVANNKKIKSFVFSSSATVYGDVNQSCVSEETPLGKPLNPYGHSKILGEKILQISSSKFKTIILRYFNPVGAHESGNIGELPNGIPNNLIPYITQTAAGKRTHLTVFGNDYNTPDGTCIRDFIHVMDLAEAHVAALDYSNSMQEDLEVFNVGTGKGNSILELIKTFEEVNNLNLSYIIGNRRPGDIQAIFTDTQKIEKTLNWKAKRSLSESLLHSWKWELRNTMK